MAVEREAMNAIVTPTGFSITLRDDGAPLIAVLEGNTVACNLRMDAQMVWCLSRACGELLREQQAHEAKQGRRRHEHQRD